MCVYVVLCCLCIVSLFLCILSIPSCLMYCIVFLSLHVLQLLIPCFYSFSCIFFLFSDHTFFLLNCSFILFPIFIPSFSLHPFSVSYFSSFFVFHSHLPPLSLLITCPPCLPTPFLLFPFLSFSSLPSRLLSLP